MRSKKSQITIFIILGIVVLIIFGFVFFIKSESTETLLEKRIEKIFGDFLSQTSIKPFIQNCLERAAKDAVRLASFQGGRIYHYQLPHAHDPGETPYQFPFKIGSSIINITYGIKAPSIRYPDGKQLVKNPAKTFGDLNLVWLFAKRELSSSNLYALPAHCNTQGPNRRDILNAQFSCETYTSNGDSVQEYLTKFIINRTEQCVNFLQFTSESTYDIQKGNVEGEVVMGNSDLTFNLKYPIEIVVANVPSTTRSLDFSYRPKWRVKKMLEYINHMIGFQGNALLGDPPEAEASNIFWNITKNDPKDCNPPKYETPCDNMNGIPVNKIRKTKIIAPCLTNNLCEDLEEHLKYTDVMNITDEATLIDGKPLTFLFAIENRAPVLSHFGDVDGKYEVPMQQTFPLTFKAADPDEDTINFEITENEDGLIFIKGPIDQGEITFSIPDGISSNHDFTLSVFDDEGLNDEQRIELIPISTPP